MKDLSDATIELSDSVPNDFDVIVGVPRSGIYVASALAMRFTRPLSYPEGLIDGRGPWVSSKSFATPIKRVLLVEDTVVSGKGLGMALEIVRKSIPGAEIRTASAYVHSGAVDKVDYYARTFENAILEWNFMMKKYGNTSMDMDGVLCQDCPPKIDGDEAAYLRWLDTTLPRFRPTYTVDSIITNRLERYRPQTEAWLRRHGIRYGELRMWDAPSKAERQDWSGNKVRHLLDLRPTIFIESDIRQAEDIHHRTSIPTICTDRMVIFQGWA